MSKRKPPPLIEAVLRFDKYVSEEICRISNRFAVIRSFNRHMKTLEYSCNGILWLVVWPLSVWFLWVKSLFQMQVNFYLGLILDIIFVALIKAAIRRRRPVGNKADTLTLGPDKYSFPSGHVSRAVFIVYFFLYLYPIRFFLPLLAWCFSVSVSRILMKRHHLLDVLGGIVLGILEGCLIGYLYLSRETSFSLIEWLTDERLDGGEYHV